MEKRTDLFFSVRLTTNLQYTGKPQEERTGRIAKELRSLKELLSLADLLSKKYGIRFVWGVHPEAITEVLSTVPEILQALQARVWSGDELHFCTDAYLDVCTPKEREYILKKGIAVFAETFQKRPTAVSTTANDVADATAYGVEYAALEDPRAVSGKVGGLAVLVTQPYRSALRRLRMLAAAGKKGMVTAEFPVEAFSKKNGEKVLEKLLRFVRKGSETATFQLPADYLRQAVLEDYRPLAWQKQRYVQKQGLSRLWSSVEKMRENLAVADYLNQMLIDPADIYLSVKHASELTCQCLRYGYFDEDCSSEVFERAVEQCREAAEISSRVLQRVEESIPLENNTLYVVPQPLYGVVSGSVWTELDVQRPWNVFEDELQGKIKNYRTEEGKRLHLLLQKVTSPKKILVGTAEEKQEKPNLLCAANSVENEFVRVVADENNHRIYVQNIVTNRTVAYLRCRIRFAGRTYLGKIVGVECLRCEKEICMTVRQKILLGRRKCEFVFLFRLREGTPYLEAEVTYVLPETSRLGKKKKSDTAKDARWKQICPLEILPLPFVHEAEGLRFDYVPNPAKNNGETCGFFALTDHMQGIVLAQKDEGCVSPAFCEMQRDKKGVPLLNVCGTYGGKYCRNAAMSYNGAQGSFAVMLRPFEGNLTEQIVQDAKLYRYPPRVLRGKFV